MADRDLDYRELSSILAALRLAQQHRAEFENMEHFIEADPLSDEEIDELCEAINCGEINGFDF